MRQDTPNTASSRDRRRRAATPTILDAEIDFDPLMKYSEAADDSRISLRTLQRLIAAGEGPPIIRLGHSRRIRRSDLRRWQDDRRG
jgi:excisionase family DNA binding protein